MSDAPERIWTASTRGKCHVGFDTPSMNYTNEYVRADRITALEAQVAAADRMADAWADFDKPLLTFSSFGAMRETARSFVAAYLATKEPKA